MDFSKIIVSCLLLLVNSELIAQESIDKIKSINGLELGSQLESLQSQLQLITGKETVYQNNPFLAERVKKNLEVGIQEGIYLGHPLRVINGIEAHDMRVTYLSGRLFKSSWKFKKRDLPNMEIGFKDFFSYFSKKFGPPSEILFNDTFIWNGEENRLILNFYDETLQIELRNNVSENKAKQLTLD